MMPVDISAASTARGASAVVDIAELQGALLKPARS